MLRYSWWTIALLLLAVSGVACSGFDGNASTGAGEPTAPAEAAATMPPEPSPSPEVASPTAVVPVELPSSALQALEVFADQNDEHFGGLACDAVPPGGAGMCYHGVEQAGEQLRLLLSFPASDYGWWITLAPNAAGDYEVVESERTSV